MVLATGHCDPFVAGSDGKYTDRLRSTLKGTIPMWFSRLIVLLLSVTAPVSAGAFEAPPVTSAEQVLGPEANGPNYRVDPEVRSDGLLHLFTIHTAFGSFEVAGDDLVRTRIRELGALRKLQAMSETDVFAKSLGEAAAAPLKYGVRSVDGSGGDLEEIRFRGCKPVWPGECWSLEQQGQSRQRRDQHPWRRQRASRAPGRREFGVDGGHRASNARSRRPPRRLPSQ